MNLIFHEIKWIKTLLTLAGFSCPTALTMTSEVSVGFVGAVSTIKAWAGIARLYLWKSKFKYSQFLKSLQYSEREKRKLRICRSQAASFFSFRVCENNYVMYVTLTSPSLLIENLDEKMDLHQICTVKLWCKDIPTQVHTISKAGKVHICYNICTPM